MRLLITILAVVSGISEGIALPIAVRDGVAMRRAFDLFKQRPGGEPGTVSSLLKSCESFMVEMDVRGLADVVSRVIPEPRPWLTWLATLGVGAGTAAAVLAVWA
jgi:hypothetical protein